MAFSSSCHPSRSAFFRCSFTAVSHSVHVCQPPPFGFVTKSEQCAALTSWREIAPTSETSGHGAIAFQRFTGLHSAESILPRSAIHA